MSKVIMSKTTSQATQVSQLVKTINAGILQSKTDKSPEPDLQLAQEADLAIVDGKSIMDGNEEEHGILISALESGLPVIMKNATSEAMTAFVGVGMDAETVILQKMGKGMQVEAIDLGELESRLAEVEASKAPDKPKASSLSTGGSSGSVSTKDTLTTATVSSLEAGSPVVSPSSFDMGVSSSAPSASSVIPPSPFSGERSDLPDGAYHAYHVQQVFRTTSWSDGTTGPILMNPGSMINIGYFIELFATDFPRQKYVQITTVGTGFSLGIAQNHSLTNRGWYLDYARNVFGPLNPQDGFLERLAPETENTSANITSSTGFGVGVQKNLGFDGLKLTGGIGVSANWDWSRSASVDLPDFEVQSVTDNNLASWSYFLRKTFEGDIYNDWKSLIDGKHLRGLPVMSYTSIPIHHQAVWRFAPDDDRIISMRFYVAAKIWHIYKNGDLWTGNSGSLERHDKYDIDLSSITHERPPIFPKPEFLSAVKRKDGMDDLVFYRPDSPDTSSIFYLKSLGNGEFEVSRTVVDFDNLKTTTTRPVAVRNYLTTHRVRAGESLSSIAYKYYHSWVPEMWKRIYEANKDMIGKNPIRPNMVLTIPFKGGPIHDIGPRG